MFKILHRHVNLSFQNCVNQSAKRYFLSNAYQCTEAWKKRLQNPALQNANSEQLYFRVIKDFKAYNRIRIIDVDLFINSLKDDFFKEELEDLLIKLRSSPETVLFPERAAYATVRWLLDHAPAPKILEILADRLAYGIFADYSLTNLLIDKFLNEKNPLAAVKIAVLQMLQEDVDHPITRAMSLYSCYNYLASSDIWEVMHMANESDDDDDDVVNVRLYYLRNPYFDDHFDIESPNHLVGKTMWLFGKSLGGPLGLSSQLVGLVLYEKYDKCVSLIKKCIEDNSVIYSSAIAMAKDFIQNKPKQQVEENKENKETSEKKESTENLDSANDKLKIEVSELLDKINKSNIIKGDLLDVSEKLLKEVIKTQEEIDIKNLCETFKNWEIERNNEIIEEEERDKVEKAMSEIDRVKLELKMEERKLYFFDNEHKIEMAVEEQEKRMKNVVHFKIKKKQDRDPQNRSSSAS